MHQIFDYSQIAMFWLTREKQWSEGIKEKYDNSYKWEMAPVFSSTLGFETFTL